MLAYAASRFGIPASDGADLLQETALELLRQRNYVRKPSGFVFTVFRARCARFLKRRRTRPEIQLPETMDRPELAWGSEQINRRVALRQALGSLSSACRRLIAAYYGEQQSLAETARRLSLAPSSVPKSLSRCLRKLRECLV